MNTSRLRLLLYPFSLIFAAIVTIRNRLFDCGILESTRYQVPLISVGNLTVGGTGKTPLTELLLRHLQQNYRCALLSRGYGRTTKGVIVANDASDARTIGDEPMQIKSRFKDLLVAVAEKRRAGMEALLAQPDPPQVVILDDAFQHRYVHPGLSMVMMDYYRPVWNDLCLPAGNLREPISGLRRADLVVVNKCPHDLSEQEAAHITKKINHHEAGSLFFSAIHYGKPLPLVPSAVSLAERLKKPGQSLIAMAGIGNPEPFFEMTRSFGAKVIPLRYPDHHNFSPSDVKKMESLCFGDKNKESLLVTTEKDAIRLASMTGLSNRLLQAIWYIPIELHFLFDAQERFEIKIDTYVAKNQ